MIYFQKEQKEYTLTFILIDTIINVKVKRGSRVPVENNGTLTIYTNEERERGKANADVIAQLKKMYSANSVSIIRGAKSSRKVILIELKDNL
jgi:uncharacterized protein YggU (UPF0235/DUF167 family)